MRSITRLNHHSFKILLFEVILLVITTNISAIPRHEVNHESVSEQSPKGQHPDRSISSSSSFANSNDRGSGRRLREGVNKNKKSSTGAIVILTTSYEGDVNNLCIALHSLQFLPGDKDLIDPADRAPVLVFNEGDLTEDKIVFLKGCLVNDHRTIAFPIIHLNDHFPPGFGNVKLEYEAYKESVGLAHQKWDGRPPEFSYANMIRFWTYLLFTHPAVQQFDTLMRMDTDSCWLPGALEDPDLTHLPFLPPGYVYHSFGPGLGVTRHFFDPETRTFFGKNVRPLIPDIAHNERCQRNAQGSRFVGLYEEWRDYAQRNDLSSSYPGMWSATVDAYEQFCTPPTFETHFEVVRRDFMQRPDVSDWHESLSERSPFGILRRRWGDALTRFMTLALFANETNVLVTTYDNEAYRHGRNHTVPKRDFKCEIFYDEISTYPQWLRKNRGDR